MTFLATNHKINLFGFQISVTARRAVRKPHHHDMRNAHRESKARAERRRANLSKTGTWEKFKAWAWEAFE